MSREGFVPARNRPLHRVSLDPPVLAVAAVSNASETGSHVVGGSINVSNKVEDDRPTKASKTSSFSSAKGNPISYSEASLQRSASILADAPIPTLKPLPNQPQDIAISHTTRDDTEQPAKVMKTSMFSSARGATVVYSEASRQRSASILKSITPATDDPKPPSSEHQMHAVSFNNTITLPIRTSMFSSAKGAAVSYSESSLQKCARILQVAQQEPAPIEALPQQVPPLGLPPRRSSSLFQSARGTRVSISEEALARSAALLGGAALLTTPAAVERPPETSNSSLADGARLFPATQAKADRRYETPKSPLQSSARPAVKTSRLFQTAKGAAVHFSEASESKSKSLLELPSTGDTPVVPATALAVRTSSFSTAGGMVVAYSEAAAQRVTSILHREDAPAAAVAAADELELPMEAHIEDELPQEPIVETPAAVEETAIDPRDAGYDFSRRFLLATPIARVSHQAIAAAHAKLRLDAVCRITSMTAAQVVLDEHDKISLSPAGMLDDLVDRLSTEELSSEMKRWIGFQVRWVVWTLASYERRFPALYLDKLLRLENVFSIVSSRFRSYTRDPAYTTALVSSGGKARFKSKASMSPLQRCCDIITLSWPLLLVLSVGQGTFQVTDGWWWATAQLDAELHALVGKGTLYDGCKIAVLSAAFESDPAGALIQLKVNSVRVARDSAKLGFVRSEYLQRGIALASIFPDGGGITAIKVIALYECPVMTRMKLQEAAPAAEARWVTLDKQELEWFQSAIMRLREKSMDRLHASKDLEIAALLDYIDCDPALAKIILGLDRGQDLELSEEMVQRVTATMNKLSSARNELAGQMLQDDQSIPNYSEQSYIDILVQCTHSSTRAWLRLQSGGDRYGPCMKIGQTFFVTNLKCHSSNGGHLVLSATSNTSMKPLPHLNMKCQFIERSPSLRAASESRPFDEILVQFYIIDWSVVEENASTVTFNIIGTDLSRCLIALKYCVPLQLKQKLHWLSAQALVHCQFALVLQCDHNNDIISCTRGSHTHITPAPATDTDAASFDQLCEIERLRFTALSSGKAYYLRGVPPVTESCARSHLLNKTVSFEQSTTDWYACLTEAPPGERLVIDDALLPLILPRIKQGQAYLCNITTAQRITSSCGVIATCAVIIFIEILDIQLTCIEHITKLREETYLLNL